MNSFERGIAKSLANEKALWHYRFPDGLGNFRPGDWVIAGVSVWGMLEAKSLVGPKFYPSQGWPQHQRITCRSVSQNGGKYWLVINFKPQSNERGRAFMWDGSWVDREIEADRLNKLTMDDPEARELLWHPRMGWDLSFLYPFPQVDTSIR